jgi:hypothetical protein
LGGYPVANTAIDHIDGLRSLPYLKPMQAAVDLEKMTLEEKLGLMEALWSQLCLREETIPVPDWHKQLLDEREIQIEKGESKFVDWETAKADIAKRLA